MIRSLFSVLCVAQLAFAALLETDYQQMFGRFMKDHQRQYHEDDVEERYAIFKKNVDLIHAHNAMNHSFTLAINPFADLSQEEFSDTYLGYSFIDTLLKHSDEETHFVDIMSLPLNGTLPTEIDWVANGAVTPVKNQGQCGSCWSFSATGAMEGAWKVAKGELVSLSEQQLVDCSTEEGNQGCNGGLMDQAFQYAISEGGLCVENDYPYKGADGTCETNCTKKVTVSKFVDVTPHDELALQVAVSNQPVSIAIQADQSIFQFYASGVLDDASCGVQLDHGVLIVGYGHDEVPKKDFWKVKNSWGPSWGEQGYIKIVRNVAGQDARQCGLATVPSFPVVA